MNYEIVNAKIKSTQLGPGANDGRGFGCWLNLDYGGGSGQGFGGYVMDKYDKEADERIGTAYGMEYIARVMDVIGVEEWEKLNGKYVRVKREAGWNGLIVAIGNIIEDKWFNPAEDLKHLL